MTPEQQELISSGQVQNRTALFFEDSPALEAEIRGAITYADDIKIKGQEDLAEFMKNKNPGDRVTFTTESRGEEKTYDIVLGQHPIDPSKGYIGIGFKEIEQNKIIQKTLAKFMNFKDPAVYYSPSIGGDFTWFMFHLLWWVMIINLLVALFNMLPLGMLDGGRFFYLTILGITGSEKFAKRAYKFMGYAILFVFLLLMFMWFIRIL